MGDLQSIAIAASGFFLTRIQVSRSQADQQITKSWTLAALLGLV